MEAVTSLISAGADVNAVNEVIVQYLLTYGVMVYIVGSHLHMIVIIQDGYFPLMMTGKTEIVSLLLKAGAAVDQRNVVNMRTKCSSLCSHYTCLSSHRKETLQQRGETLQ